MNVFAHVSGAIRKILADPTLVTLDKTALLDHLNQNATPFVQEFDAIDTQIWPITVTQAP